MAKEDIIGGLRNAIERGESLESAMQSFVNAGYNANEVKEAAQSMGFGVGGTTIVNSPSPEAPDNKIVGSIQNAPARKLNKKVIALIVILMILAIVLGVTLLFKEKIIEWVAGL